MAQLGVMILIKTSVGSQQILCLDHENILSHQGILAYGRELHKDSGVSYPDTDISYRVTIQEIL